jgi:hypothetical protein
LAPCIKTAVVNLELVRHSSKHWDPKFKWHRKKKVDVNENSENTLHYPHRHINNLEVQQLLLWLGGEFFFLEILDTFYARGQQHEDTAAITKEHHCSRS